jgi:hypothetical protein
VKEKVAVSEVVLHSPWPNPSDGDVNIGFTLPRTRPEHDVNLEMMDMMGRKVRNFSKSFPAGYNLVNWNCGSEAPGLYLVTIKTAGAFNQARLVLK